MSSKHVLTLPRCWCLNSTYCLWHGSCKFKFSVKRAHLIQCTVAGCYNIMITNQMLLPISSFSQGSGETGSLKFFGAMITVWVPMFLICWFGDLLREQVLFIIFCVTTYYSYTIKRTTDTRINNPTINPKLFSDSIFYCPQRATCFGFFKIGLKHKSISITRRQTHLIR
jgi:hypothetical protein